MDSSWKPEHPIHRRSMCACSKKPCLHPASAHLPTALIFNRGRMKTGTHTCLPYTMDIPACGCPGVVIFAVSSAATPCPTAAMTFFSAKASESSRCSSLEYGPSVVMPCPSAVHGVLKSLQHHCLHGHPGQFEALQQSWASPSTVFPDAQRALPVAIRVACLTILRRSGCRRMLLAGYPVLAAIRGQEAILSGWNQVSCL